MAISQKRSKRKVSGGRYKKFKTKRLHGLGGLPTLTKIGKRKIKTKKVSGGNLKSYILNEEFVNVYDPKNKKIVKTKLLTVIGNPANRHYIRRNILTKGAIVKTELGDVRITSRPGQAGSLSGVLIQS